MKSNDYVRFLTKTFVEHFEMPKEERLRRKMEKKQQKLPFTYKWFGILPYSVKEGVKMMKRKRIKS